MPALRRASASAQTPQRLPHLGLLVAAAICYVPANVLPATRAISFGYV